MFVKGGNRTHTLSVALSVCVDDELLLVRASHFHLDELGGFIAQLRLFTKVQG